MPVTVTIPSQGDAIGPGTRIQASSSLGVIPAGAHWDALVFTANTSDQILIDALDFNNTPSIELILGRRRDTASDSPVFVPQDAFPAVGAEHSLVVRVISAQSTILDTSGPIGVVWRPEPWGTAYIQSLAASSPVDGGFTETDRQTLVTTEAAVLAQLPLTAVGGGVLSLGLDQLVKGPPIDFLSEGEQLLLSGRGSLTRASGSTGVYAYGGRWSLESAPGGLGKEDGQAVRFEQRIVQFVVVKARLGGGNYAWQIEDSHYDSGELSWPIPFPVRIDFYILPGVTVRWRWLLLLQ